MKNTVDVLKGEMKGISKIYDNVLKEIDKNQMKAKSRGWGAYGDFLAEAKPKIEVLKHKKTFPTTADDLKNVDVAIKSKILKAELKAKFPTIPFQVRASRYSGGSSIDVSWTDGVPQKAVEPIVKKYSHPGKTDSREDYFDYDNYAFAQRSISKFEERLKKLKSKGLTEDEARMKLFDSTLPSPNIESLKKQIKQSQFKRG